MMPSYDVRKIVKTVLNEHDGEGGAFLVPARAEALAGSVIQPRCDVADGQYRTLKHTSARSSRSSKAMSTRYVVVHCLES